MVEFHENIAHGILLPRWAPDLSHGAGQPLFLFNPPLFYYLGEFWHLVGFDFVQSINLALIVIVVASASECFCSAGYISAPPADGWPQRLICTLRTSPWICTSDPRWPNSRPSRFSRSLCTDSEPTPRFGGRRYVLIGAAAFAGVLLCHNPAALLFGPLLGAFLVFTSWTARSWIIFRRQVYAVLLGLGLAAFVWVPSLVRNKDVQVQSLLDGYSRYTNHFVALHQFFDSPWGYGLSVLGDQDGMSFALGWSHLLIIALALFWLIRRPNLTINAGSGSSASPL